MNRLEKLQELKRYYSSTLAEDQQNSSNFDCAVLDAIEEVEKRFENDDAHNAIIDGIIAYINSTP